MSVEPKKKGALTMSNKQNDLLAGLHVAVPDTKASMKILTSIVDHKKKRDELDAERAIQQAQRAKEAAQQGQDQHDSDDALEQLVLIQEKLKAQLGANEFLEDEQVFFPTDAESLEEPDITVDKNFADKVTASLKDLGLNKTVGNSSDILSDVFKSSVLSGSLRADLAKAGTCGQNTVLALFNIMAYSSDLQLAGAAFITLLHVMNDEKLSTMCVDAIALPETAIPVTMEALPSTDMLIDALKANGYRPSTTNTGAAGTSRGRKRASMEDDEDEDTNSTSGELRLQTVKLILQCTAAVCRYCTNHPTTPASSSAINTTSTCELIKAVLHLGIDPVAVRYQHELDTALPPLLSALSDKEWKKALPQLASDVASMGPSAKAHLRVVKALPNDVPRGLALQQYVGCLLLETIIPSKSKAVVAAAKAVNPVAVIKAQPWFTQPKKLVGDATSGGAGPASSSKGYLIEQVELLLKSADVVLWPWMLRRWRGDSDDGQVLTHEFLEEWTGFLATLAKNIKSLQPEDQFVRGLAVKLELDYKNYMGECGAVEDVDKDDVVVMDEDDDDVVL